MNYNLALRKFITSQYLYTGIKITAGVLIPSLLLYNYGVLNTMMGIPLGALFVALSDNPGPRHHRINGMLVSIVINFIVICVAGYSVHSPILTGIEIVIFSFLFSMFGVYGLRANSIGLTALIVFIISYGSHNSSAQNILYTAIYFACGGVWYLLFSIASNTLRPYKLIEQLLGEYLIETGNYLHAKALFYDKDTDTSKIFSQLLHYQVTIQQQQTALQEIIFKTRMFLNESTNKSRRLMMIFLDSVDLLERIMTSQQDYKQLHKEFASTTILLQYKKHINLLANTLFNTGLAVQAGSPYNTSVNLDAAIEESRQAFFSLRNSSLHAGNVEGFIKLRHILHSLSDITERIKRIQGYTFEIKKISRQVSAEEKEKLASHQDFNLRLFLSNLSLKSSQFRHALRLVIAMLAGYIISLLFPLGHSYWILLAIATIIKPEYSISRKRNIERVGGTFVGVLAGFLILHFAQNNTAIFVIMMLSMIAAYSFLKIQYLISTGSITLYILLSFHFLYPTGLSGLLTDRILDTVIGSVIAFTCSYFIFPVWSHQQLNNLLLAALEANRNYFAEVANLFSADNKAMLSYKIARKEAFLTLANLSDALQRMISEPKNQQPNLHQYHQLVTANHMLTSYIASMAYYAQQYGEKYGSRDFIPMIGYITRQLDTVVRLLKKQNDMFITATDKFPINKKVQQLLEQRKTELESGQEINATAIRKTLSETKTITDQLQLISSIVTDEIKIIKELQL